MAVLDSSVIISLISGSSSGELLRKRFGEESFSTTSISINEVFIGLTEKQRQSVSPFFHGIEILPFDSEAAFRSVDLEKSMRAKGRLIGKPDIFIAAICSRLVKRLLQFRRQVNYMVKVRFKFGTKSK